MPDLEGMLTKLEGATVEQLELERTDRGLRATTAGGRKQDVTVKRVGDDVVLESVAAPPGAVPEARRAKARARFIRRLWEVNARTDLVALGLDSYGRIVGTCRHPLATLDRPELESYLVALVRECDRLEWLLTGEDRY